MSRKLVIGVIVALELLAADLERGDAVTYGIRRDGIAASVDVILESPYRSWQFALGTWTTVTVACCFLAISLLVAWSRPTSRSALVFFAMSSTGAAAYVLLAVVENRFPDTRGVTPVGVDPWALGILFASLLITVGMSNLILHLALVFPRERPFLRRHPRLFAWLHSLPFVPAATVPLWLGLAAATRHTAADIAVELGAATLLAIAAVRVVRRVRRHGLLDGILGAPATVLVAMVVVGAHGLMLLRLIPAAYRTMLGVVFGIAFSFWFVATMVIFGILTCVVLVRSYRESGAEERHQVRWPLWGTATAIAASLAITVLSVVVISLDPSSLAASMSSSLSVVNKLVYLLIPLSFAFAILKYRLLEIDILIRRTFVYGAMTTIVVATYLVSVGIGGLTVVRLESGGPAIARVFRDLAYTDGELPLTIGDTLLLCTDGATEASDRDGELLGDTRLEELAAAGRGRGAAAVLDHVEAAVLDWAAGRLEDNLTLVAATVRSRDSRSES